MVGQARLVMAERFVQFSGLVDNCEFKQGEKETTCTDLRGFWEMIYFQVKIFYILGLLTSHTLSIPRLKMSTGNLSS